MKQSRDVSTACGFSTNIKKMLVFMLHIEGKGVRGTGGTAVWGWGRYGCVGVGEVRLCGGVGGTAVWGWRRYGCVGVGEVRLCGGGGYGCVGVGEGGGGTLPHIDKLLESQKQL